jgi:hypothetical protein
MPSEDLYKAFKWCLGVFLCGIPGTLFFLLVKARHGSDWFKDRLYVMRARVIASAFLLALGLLGMVVVGSLIAMR